MLPTDVIESAAARNLADYVAAFNAVAPEVGATALEIEGGTAAFTGAASPLTTIKGIGPLLTDDDIDAAEQFFAKCGAGHVTFELAPWVSRAGVEQLTRRGYGEVATESVVVRPVPLEARAPVLSIREVGPERWAEVLLEVSELPREDSSKALARAAAHLANALDLAVEDEAGGLLACAQLAPAGDVAIFGNDNTRPDARGRGYQRMLIEARLVHARRLGLEHAVAEVAPGSGSERNYLRCGFERAYVRTHYSREVR